MQNVACLPDTFLLEQGHNDIVYQSPIDNRLTILIGYIIPSMSYNNVHQWADDLCCGVKDEKVRLTFGREVRFAFSFVRPIHS